MTVVRSGGRISRVLTVAGREDPPVQVATARLGFVVPKRRPVSSIGLPCSILNLTIARDDGRT